MANIQFDDHSTLAMIELGKIKQKPRPYLGMSGLGHFCERYLWLNFHWAHEEEISQRLRRLYKRGHREEPCLIEELNRIGIEVYGDQTEVSHCDGHILGHCDGICIGVKEAPKTEHLAEFKTMNDKYFKEVKKLGVRESKPVYFAQMQVYMRKLKLSRALFMAVNKNDDELYCERVRLDSGFADELLERGSRIVYLEYPETRKYKNTLHLCKMCDSRHVCSGDVAPARNCRTCKFSLPVAQGAQPHQGGGWVCCFDLNHFGAVPIPLEIQRKGCPQYTLRDMKWTS